MSLLCGKFSEIRFPVSFNQVLLLFLRYVGGSFNVAGLKTGEDSWIGGSPQPGGQVPGGFSVTWWSTTVFDRQDYELCFIMLFLIIQK